MAIKLHHETRWVYEYNMHPFRTCAFFVKFDYHEYKQGTAIQHTAMSTNFKVN